MAEAASTVDKSNSKPVIERILASYKNLPNWERSVTLELSDGFDLIFSWDKKGKLYYRVMDRKNPPGMSYDFDKRNACYEMNYDRGSIKDIKVPDMLKEMEVDGANQVTGVPVEVSDEPKPKTQVKRSVAGSGEPKRRGRPPKNKE